MVAGIDLVKGTEEQLPDFRGDRMPEDIDRNHGG
jgi:hypothetical protein